MSYWLSTKTMISKGTVEIKRQVVSKIFPIILTLICLIKLFLTRTSEIVASPTDTHYRRNKHPSNSTQLCLSLFIVADIAC